MRLLLLLSLLSFGSLSATSARFVDKSKEEVWAERNAANYPLWLDFVRKHENHFPEPRGLKNGSERCAVIVETRLHPHLSFVLRNVLHFLGDAWSLCIVHGNDNAEYLKELVKGWGEVTLINLDVAGLDAESYNALCRTREFWEKIPGEDLLFFQTDTMLLRGGIEDFLGYDWVGAPWAGRLDGSWTRIKVSEEYPGAVGNGGLSFRRKSALLKILSTHTRPIGMAEDVFFSKWMTNDGYRVPSPRIARKFSVETIFYPRPLGFHKPWASIRTTEFQQLLERVQL